MTVERSARSVVVGTARTPHARLRPVPIGEVRLEGGFWGPRLATTRRVSLRQQFEQLVSTGRLASFAYVAGRAGVDVEAVAYGDSDVYKWLEAASFALASEPDAELERLVDGLVADVAAAQSEDGYLNTAYAFERAGRRWADLSWSHELYTAGHLIQAAIAHRRATGRQTLFEVAVRQADLICELFGPDARHETDGHPEIELALVELYRETGRATYLQRAGFFLDLRGRQPPVLTGQQYMQDHLPARRQTEVVGHAVRAAYLACGMADVAMEIGDVELDSAVEALWRSAFTRKVYLTGGLGSRWLGEAFGEDYELPNERAYAETCAAIAGAMWSWRLLLRSGKARFADWLETALYNGVLAGVSLDGTAYFYTNPLADGGSHRRQPWFSCACCPPNVARMLLSLPGYCYSTSEDGLWVHLYARGAMRCTLPGGAPVALRVETEYPWSGRVRLLVEETPEEPWSLFLRVPAWCDEASLSIGGRSVETELHPGAYVTLRRAWRAGDQLELDLAMPVRRVVSHPRVAANTGRVALMRGPLVYCVEAADHRELDVRDLRLPPDTKLAPEDRPDQLGGIVVIRGRAEVESPSGWDDRLYAPGRQPARTRPAELVAIPYFAWANRAPGPMQVWLRRG